MARKATEERHVNMNHDMFDTARFDEMEDSAKALKETIKKGKGELDTFPEMMEDMFYSVFKHNPSYKPETDVDPQYHLNRGFLQAAMNTPEWSQLRAKTKLDPLNSATAAASLGETLLNDHGQEIAEIQKHIQKMAQDAKDIDKLLKEQAKLNKQLTSKKTPQNQQQQLQNQANVLAQKVAKLQQGCSASQGAMQQAVQKVQASFAIPAVQQALQTVDLQETLACGWGTESGSFTAIPYEERVKLSNAIVHNKRFLKIAQLAGRMSRLATRKQREKTKHSFEEIADIKEGRDVTRAIPSELMLLCDDDLETVFYKKLVEGNLLSYDLQGEETKAKGPIIVCIDISGSMSGDPDTWCKAVALALVQIAHKEKRNAIVIPFDTHVKTVFEFYKEDGFNAEKVLEMASYFSGGGTNFDPPLTKAMEYLQKESHFKEGDIIMVTDGEAPVSDSVKEAFLDLKKKLKFSLITIVIGSEFGYVTHSLQALSEYLYPVSSLTDELAGTIFESV